jgi:hypothetical protein
MSAKKSNPGFDNEDDDRDSYLKKSLGEESAAENLSFNEKDDSFEFDVESDDPDYDHPDPYNSSVKNGSDFDSSYDEANPYAVDEYIPDESLETDVDDLGMHIDKGNIVRIDPMDEIISRTPEDKRTDLDEEGYPINDTPKKIKK